jgi:hypothetical protein
MSERPHSRTTMKRTIRHRHDPTIGGTALPPGHFFTGK